MLVGSIAIKPLGFQRKALVLRPGMSREGFKEGMGSESDRMMKKASC